MAIDITNISTGNDIDITSASVIMYHSVTDILVMILI